MIIEINGYIIDAKQEKGSFFATEKLIVAPGKTGVPETIPFDLKEVDLPFSSGRAGVLEVVYQIRAYLKGVKGAEASSFFERRLT